MPVAAFALDVGLSGAFPGKAVLVVNGALRTVQVGGQSPEGVKLLSLDGNSAQVEVEGKRLRLSLGAHAYAPDSGGGRESLSLIADSHGQFFAQGSVNGSAVNFLVDTGASQVSIGRADAQRMGLRYQEGTRGVSQTANGRAAVWSINLARVRLGPIELNNVDALVLEQGMPMVLLGMSFLNRLDMRREGDTMTLRRRF